VDLVARDGQVLHPHRSAVAGEPEKLHLLDVGLAVDVRRDRRRVTAPGQRHAGAGPQVEQLDVGGLEGHQPPKGIEDGVGALLRPAGLGGDPTDLGGDLEAVQRNVDHCGLQSPNFVTKRH
jgi:hypothetical protein